ncbi:MAG TPA: tetratricopeptide repeat protein [Candidatus Sulfotelmatobacter sp.]|nr:tetratricopeptide repeat protein [Candidatus Sulfotelmatobacter sp.]
MAVATEHRVPMVASKFLAGVVLAAAVCGCVVAQDAGQSPAASPPSSSSSSAHKQTHHIQVPDDDAPTLPTELTQAEAAIEKQNYPAAESLLHKLLERDATSYVGWFDLGFVENALGNVDASIAAYRKSVAAKPDVFESNLNLGLQLAKTSQPDAQEFLRAATRLKPTSHVAEGQYRAWLALGQALEKSRPDEALDAFQHAAALQPKETEPHFAAGMLLEQENKFAEAKQEYKQALALDPTSTEAVMGLANIYMRGRRFPEAEDYLRKLLAQNLNSAPVQIQLGRVLAAEGKNDEAIAALQAGLKLSPRDEGVQQELAEVYTTAGKNDLAESTYSVLVAAHPKDAELHRRLGQTYLRQNNSKQAQEEFLTAVALKPDLGEAYGDLAFAAGENQNYALALKALDARSKLLPENPVTYFLRASACDHLKDFKTAAVNYHLFLKTADGKYPDYEWKAKHRLIAIEPKK